MDFYANLTFKVQKGRGLGSRNPISKFWYPPNNFWTNRAIRFKFGTDIEDGPLRRADQKNDPKVGVAWVTWPNFEILGPPCNFWTNRDICFKFGTDMEDGPLLRSDHETTPKWARPGSRDLISKFCDPLITFEPIEQSASNLVQRWRTDPSCVWTIKRPPYGRGLGHVTQFRNYGTPNNFWTNRAIRFKFGDDIEDWPSLRTDYKTTSKWGVAGVT